MRFLFCLVVSGLFSTFGSAVAQDQPASAQIESWPQAKIVAMGREIYRQDRAAWLATDALLAAHARSELSDIRGWIVVPASTGDVVRFLAADDAGVRARWDVPVDSEGAGPVREVSESALPPEDLARWTARQTAIANADPVRCGPALNSVVARDPDGPGWLVWLLTATTQDGVIPIGGHQRLRISADGRILISRERLSAACLNLTRPDGADGATIPFVTHIVSDGPVETHVFLSIQNQTVIFVGTKDKLFAVEGDHISEQAMPQPAP